MSNSKTPAVPYSLIRPYFATIKMLNVLLDKSNLTNEVKAHCKLGLSAVGIIYTGLSCNSGMILLYQKEFDEFFSLFPKDYANNRGLTPVTMIITNLELCIEVNDIVNAT